MENSAFRTYHIEEECHLVKLEDTDNSKETLFVLLQARNCDAYRPDVVEHEGKMYMRFRLDGKELGIPLGFWFVFGKGRKGVCYVMSDEQVRKSIVEFRKDVPGKTGAENISKKEMK